MTALAGDIAHGVIELHIGRAGVTRAAEGADQPKGAGHRLHLLAFEEVFGDFGGRSEDHLLEDAGFVGGFEVRRELGERWRIGEGVAIHHLGRFFHEGVVVIVGARVFFGEAGDLGDEFVVIFPGGQRAAVGKRHEKARIATDELNAAPGVEVVDDRSGHEGEDVGTFRKQESGFDLLGKGGPADVAIAFQHERAIAGLCKVRRGYEAVVSATDDDCIVGFVGHGRCSHLLATPSIGPRTFAANLTLAGQRAGCRSMTSRIPGGPTGLLR